MVTEGIYIPGRFCLGLLLIGGLCLWVRQRRAGDGLPTIVEELLESRMHYGLVGGMVGYTALPDLQLLLDESTVLAVAFFGGWCGLVVGLGFDLRILRRSSSAPLVVEGGRAGLVALLVLVLAYVSSPLLEPAGLSIGGAGLLMLCAVGVTGVTLQRRALNVPKAKLKRWGWQPSLAAGIGVVLAGLGSMQLRQIPFVIRQPFASMTKVIVVEGLASEVIWTLVLGAVIGFILDLITRGAERGELFFLIGSGLALGCGIAAGLGLEPLWIGLVAGTWLINCTLRRLDILQIVERSHRMMKVGLYFTAGWLLGYGLVVGGIDVGIFLWIWVIVVILQPLGHFGGGWIARKVLGRGALDRSREEKVDGPGLDSLGVVIALGLAGVLEKQVGLAVLAGVMVGQWVLLPTRVWLERLEKRYAGRGR